MAALFAPKYTSKSLKTQLGGYAEFILYYDPEIKYTLNSQWSLDNSSIFNSKKSRKVI